MGDKRTLRGKRLNKRLQKLWDAEYRITPAYRRVFEELSDKRRYRTYSVYEFYVKRKKKRDRDKVNVVVRIDVDNSLHLCVPLAEELKKYGIHATFYFLTHPDRYYRIWDSDIPKIVKDMGFEVGLHSDHYFEELKFGVDGLKKLKEDIKKLSELIGEPIKGMTYHGHEEIDKMGVLNWDLYKFIDPKELGLSYHDGYTSVYIKPGACGWEPDCDVRISDFMGFPRSWGWNYYPDYPLRKLRSAKKGELVHIAFHVKNAFYYWENWTEKYGEKPIPSEDLITFLKKALKIFMRYGIQEQFLGGRGPKLIFYHLVVKLISIYISKFMGAFFSKPSEPLRDTSWEAGREMIFSRGIDYWRERIEFLGLDPKGKRILEVGSGNGQWLLAFAYDAKEVVGIEPSDEVREYSLKKLREFPELSAKIKVMKGYAEGIPFPDEHFDIVFCAGVLMFTDQDRALKEMVRVLKPGGELLITVNGLGYYIMYILEGLKHRNRERAEYGLYGLLGTLLKLNADKLGVNPANIPPPKGVVVSEMEKKLSHLGCELIDVRIFLSQKIYSLDYFGFPTNYAFLAVKK